MKTMVIGLAVLLAGAGAAPAHAAAPGPDPAAKAAPAAHRKAKNPRKVEVPGGLQIASWASFDDDAKSTARLLVGRDSVITIEPNGSEHVTVFGKKRDRREQDWRGDIGAATPAYEASNSGAASSPYTSYPQWDSPQEMHTMSTVKDTLGLCDVPPFSCPQ